VRGEILKPAGKWGNITVKPSRPSVYSHSSILSAIVLPCNHGKAGIAAKPLRELAHGQIVTPGDIGRPLTAAFRGVAFADIVGQRTVGSNLTCHGRVRWKASAIASA